MTTTKSDKGAHRHTLELIAADLRHAYSFLAQGRLVEAGQKNVAGLIERQVKRLEEIMAFEDERSAQLGAHRIFRCPLGCGYYTGTLGEHDASARLAVAAHLRRRTHGLDRGRARQLAADITAEQIARPGGEA